MKKEINKRNDEWLAKFLGIELIPYQTKMDDIIYLLAKRIEKLENRDENKS